jgi:hypothetical protein
MANNWTAYPYKVSKLSWSELTGFQQLTYSSYHTKSNYVTNVLNNYGTPLNIKVNSRIVYNYYINGSKYNCVIRYSAYVIQMYKVVYLLPKLLVDT